MMTRRRGRWVSASTPVLSEYARAVLARHAQAARGGTGVDENAFGGKGLLAAVWPVQFDRAIIEKLGARVEHGYAVQIVQFGEIGGAQFRNQGVFRVHRRRKHRRFVGVMPALLASTISFCWNTADVDASAAVHLRRLFHQHDLLPVFRQIRRQRFARFAKADKRFCVCIICLRGNDGLRTNYRPLSICFYKETFAKSPKSPLNVLVGFGDFCRTCTSVPELGFQTAFCFRQLLEWLAAEAAQ